jgi:hypothetical protein
LLFVLLLTMFAIITVFLAFIAMPIFLRLNKIRREFWTELFTHLRAVATTIKISCIDRLAQVHQLEDEVVDISSSDKKKHKGGNMKYNTHIV